jgi:nucleotide-binding universal stress UspA family protein
MEFHKILIAIDTHPSSEIVALNGLQLAKQFNSEIALISIIDPDSIPDEGTATSRELDDMMEHNLNHSQVNVIEKIFKDYPVKSFVEKGVPSKVILKTAESWGADIIVMGTHGRKGLPHLLMGSVAEEVARHSKKALIIIPVTN